MTIYSRVNTQKDQYLKTLAAVQSPVPAQPTHCSQCQCDSGFASRQLKLCSLSVRPRIMSVVEFQTSLLLLRVHMQRVDVLSLGVAAVVLQCLFFILSVIVQVTIVCIFDIVQRYLVFILLKMDCGLQILNVKHATSLTTSISVKRARQQVSASGVQG